MFRALRPYTIVLAAVVILLPVGFGLLRFRGVDFRDDLDFYALMMASPIFLVFPLIATVLACTGLYQDLGHRFASYKRLRMRPSKYVVSNYANAAAISFVVFFLFAFVPFILAFLVWPLVGDPHVDPSGYGLHTAYQVVQDSYTRFSYTSILKFGALAFGVGYSGWLGLCAAVYACIGVTSLLIVRNRVLAMAIPFLVFFVQTLVAALVGSPQLGLAYSAFPFGLQQSPVWLASSPTIVLAIAAAVAGWATLRSASVLQNLA